MSIVEKLIALRADFRSWRMARRFSQFDRLGLVRPGTLQRPRCHRKTGPHSCGLTVGHPGWHLCQCSTRWGWDAA